jgi:transposase
VDVDSFYKKKLNYSWHRIRKYLKPKQDPEEYQAKIIQLCGLLWLEKQGFTKIYYADESGFNLTPYIPYGWQEKGNPICIVPSKSKSINAFGLFTRDNELAIYTSEQNINGDLAIAFIDDFCRSMKQPSTIVIDNAPIHHSSNFKDKIQEWEEQGLYVFYLPRYSPHLNLIETLWRKIKYEWLKAHHYLNWHTFATALNYIFCNIGNEFTINFKDQLAENI